MKKVFSFFVIFFLFAASGFGQEPAQVLARILAQKGLIGTEELARVEAASPEEGVRLLAALLRSRGVITEAEAARVSALGAPASRGHFAAAELGAGGARVETPPPAVIPVAYAMPQNVREAPKPAPAPPPVTSQSKLPVTVYGTLLWNAAFNTTSTNNEDVPLFVAKQGSDPFHAPQNFAMTVRQTRLGMRYQGPQAGGARLSGQFEFDLFNGKAALANGISMDSFRLRMAYGRLDWKKFSFEAGQDWSVFAPLNPVSLAGFAIPDFAASGNLWIRSPMLMFEFRHDLSDRSLVQLQVAATDPDLGDYPAEFRTARQPLAGERGRAPGLDARLGFTTRIADRRTAAGLSSHYSRGRNTGTVGGRPVRVPVDSWGIALDYNLPLHARFALSGEAFAGRALGIFSGGIAQSYLPPGTLGEHGLQTRGGWAQAEFNLAPRWQAHAGFGLEVPDASELRTGDRSRTQTVMSNLYYRYSPHVTLAWEWRRFLTNYQNQRQANERGDHLNMAVAYTF